MCPNLILISQTQTALTGFQIGRCRTAGRERSRHSAAIKRRPLAGRWGGAGAESGEVAAGSACLAFCWGTTGPWPLTHRQTGLTAVSVGRRIGHDAWTGRTAGWPPDPRRPCPWCTVSQTQQRSGVVVSFGLSRESAGTSHEPGSECRN